MYIGTSSSDLMLKDVKLTAKDNKVSTLRFQTSQKAVADQLETSLQTRLGHSPFASDGKKDGTVPLYPVFNGVKDPIVRALIAMMLGCDACPGGIPGIGPKRAFEIHQEFNAKSCQSVQQLHEDLATLISKTPRAPIKDHRAILCLYAIQ